MLDQRNLSDEIADRIRDMIFDGRLAADSRINEVHLAGHLGVSRTPVREALRSLVSEGALYSVPRRGFFVHPLTLEEAAQIYPMRSLLDPEALRLSGVPSPATLTKLEQITGRLGSSRSVKDAIEMDDRWHRTLWSGCKNSVLKQLIEQFMRRTRRYELASMGQAQSVQSSVRSKTEIERALKTRDVELACSLLRESLLKGGEPVYAWLATRETNGAERNHHEDS